MTTMRQYHYSGPFKTNGFTILELMITVAIVAIIATIAIPSYNSVMAKTDRSIAIADINEISLVQGRFFSANRAYTDDFKDLNMASTTGDTLTDSDDYYNYTLDTTNSAANYTVVATPKNSRDAWILRLDDRNQKMKKSGASASWETGWP